MKNSSRAILLAVCSISILGASLARAEHHQADLLKAKIGQFYMNLSSGEFEDALAFVKSGSSGYMHFGLLGDIPNDQYKAVAAASMKEEWDQGIRVQIMPKHMSITELGDDHALATYYAEGMETDEEGEKEHLLNRVSLVLAKEGNDWMIVHWHVSKLEREDEDDD